MPLLLIGSGLVLMLVGLSGDAAQFYTLLASDFSGPGSFIFWLASILLVGALGYIKGLENLSKLFLILIVIVLFLDNGGFFAQFQAFLNQTTKPATPAASTSSSSTGSSTTATPSGSSTTAAPSNPLPTI